MCTLPPIPPPKAQLFIPGAIIYLCPCSPGTDPAPQFLLVSPGLPLGLTLSLPDPFMKTDVQGCGPKGGGPEPFGTTQRMGCGR